MKLYKINGYQRISKKNAEHRYNNGEIIYLCPFKMRPGQPWNPEVAITKTDLKKDCGSQYFVTNTREFEKLVSDFAFYNCNFGAGKYPAYYIKEEKDE